MQEIILEDHSHPLADYNLAPQKTGRLQQTEAKPNQNPSPAQPRRTKRTQPIQYIRIGARARTCWSQRWEPQCYHFFKQLVLLECKRFCLMSFLIYYNLQKFVFFLFCFPCYLLWTCFLTMPLHPLLQKLIPYSLCPWRFWFYTSALILLSHFFCRLQGLRLFRLPTHNSGQPSCPFLHPFWFYFTASLRWGDWNCTLFKITADLLSGVLTFSLLFTISFPEILCIPLAFLTSAEHWADVFKEPSAMMPGPLLRANLNPIIVSALDFYRHGISAAILLPRHLILSDSSATFCSRVYFCLHGITLYHQQIAARHCRLSSFSSSFMRILNCTGSQGRYLVISLHCENCPVICIFYFLSITSYSEGKLSS